MGAAARRPVPRVDAAAKTADRGPRGPLVRPVRPEEWEEAGRATRAGFVALVGEDDRDYLDLVADVAGRCDRTTVLVAVADDGRILGSVTVELTGKVNPERELEPGEAHLRMLGVAPEAQGRGVGRALVEAAAALARSAGKSRLTLGTRPEMAGARRLYDRVGFRAGPPAEWAPGHDYLTYELDLEAGPAGI
jgi:ribosomal protein S18 acetylase RimI-like enzyme